MRRWTPRLFPVIMISLSYMMNGKYSGMNPIILVLGISSLFYFPRFKFFVPIRCGIAATRQRFQPLGSILHSEWAETGLIPLSCKMWLHIYILCAWFSRRRISLVDNNVMSQLSTGVQQTTEVAALMPAALTTWTASHVPVCLDTPVMDLPVQVSHFTLTFTHTNYNVINTNSVCVTVTLSDYNHIFTAHVCKRSRFTYCLKRGFRLTGTFSVRHFFYHVEFHACFPLGCEIVRMTMFSAIFGNSIIGLRACKDGNFTSV